MLNILRYSVTLGRHRCLHSQPLTKGNAVSELTNIYVVKLLCIERCWNHGVCIPLMSIPWVGAAESIIRYILILKASFLRLDQMFALLGRVFVTGRARSQD